MQKKFRSVLSKVLVFALMLNIIFSVVPVSVHAEELSGTIPMVSGNLKVEVNCTDDGLKVTSLYDTAAGREMLSSKVTKPLFSLEMSTGEKLEATSGWTTVTANNQGGVYTYVFSGHHSVDGLEVTVTADTTTNGAIRWQIKVNNDSQLSIHNLVFPQFAIDDLGEDAKVFFPNDCGEINHSWSTGKSWKSGYPCASCEMAYMAAYNGETGVYLGMHDPNVDYVTLFATGDANNRAATLGFETLAPNDGVIGNDYDRDAVIELSITTGWYEAAMHYREWVSNNAVWWPEIDENGRVDTPQWFKELNVWTKTENWNGETPADTTRLVLGFQEYMDMPVGNHWYRWHDCLMDGDFPEYFPAKDGFAEAVKIQQENNIYVMPYQNALLWESTTDSFKNENAESAACKKPNGEMYLGAWNVATGKLASMCSFTELWQDKVAEFTMKLFNDYDVMGGYQDMVGLWPIQACYDESHGHTVGGGNYWVGGYQTLYEKLRAQLREEKGDDRILTTEGTADAYTSCFDAQLAYVFSYGGGLEKVPAVHAVLAGATQLMGRYYSLGESDLIWRQKNARSFVWGEQLGWCDANIYDAPTKGSYLRDTAKVRDQINQYLYAGVMGKPLELEGNTTVLAQDNKPTYVVENGVWMRPQDDQAVVLFANIVDDAQTLTVNMDLADYGLDCTAAQVIVRGPSGIIDEFYVDGSFSKELNLEGAEVQAWEIIPVDQKEDVDSTVYEEARKYQTNAFIPYTAEVGADVTSFVAQLKDGMQADPSIKVSFTVAPGSYLGISEDGTSIRLTKEKDTVNTASEFVVITFEKDGKTATTEVTVLVQSSYEYVVTLQERFRNNILYEEDGIVKASASADVKKENSHWRVLDQGTYVYIINMETGHYVNNKNNLAWFECSELDEDNLESYQFIKGASGGYTTFATVKDDSYINVEHSPGKYADNCPGSDACDKAYEHKANLYTAQFTATETKYLPTEAVAALQDIIAVADKAADMDFDAEGLAALANKVQAAKDMLADAHTEAEILATSNAVKAALAALTFDSMEKTTYEMEEGILFGSTLPLIGDADGASDFTGTGFVRRIASTGQGVRLVVGSKDGGLQQIDVRYVHGFSGIGTMGLVVNGEFVRNLDFPSTGSWTSGWKSTSYAVNLRPGLNVIEIKRNDTNDDVDMDHLVLYPDNQNNIENYELEAGDRTGTVDGDLSDWNLNATLSRKISGSSAEENEINFGVQRDAEYLYLAAQVKDATLKAGATLQAGDSVEFYLSTEDIRTSMHSSMPECVKAIIVGFDGQFSLTNLTEDDVRIAVMETEDGYAVEVAVSLAALGAQGEGDHNIGVAVYNNDLDASAVAVKGWSDNGGIHSNDFSQFGMVSFKGISKEIADAKDLLKETIDQAEEEKKNYPEHLVEAIRVLFEQALEDAWAAYNNPNATLDEIREADDTLIEIMQYLDYTADPSGLEEAIARAKEIVDSGKYLNDDNMQTYIDLIAEAEALLEDETALDPDFEAMIERMQQAEANLTEKPQITFDLEELKHQIGLADLIKLEEYLDGAAKDAFNAAYLAAKDVYAKALAQDAALTQDEVDKAAKDLHTARMNLRLIPNKDKLKELLANANAKEAAKYTADSFAMLTAAVTAGQLVYDDPQADVTMVKEAERVLQTALDSLVLIQNGANTPSENPGEEPATGVSSPVMVLALLGAVSLGFLLLLRKRNRIAGR